MELGSPPALDTVADEVADAPFMLGPDAPRVPSEGYLIGRQSVAQRNAIPLVDSRRTPGRLRWFAAARRLYVFGKNKEKTSEVFRVFEALPWRSLANEAAAFVQSERGRRLYESEPFLPLLLDDHEALRRDFPAGSLAHDYADYMETEGLTAAGLVAEYEDAHRHEARINDQVEWYVDRLRDTHDLLHMLTDIGRDTFGEQCLAAWVHGQRPSPGHLFMGYVGAMVIKVQDRASAPLIKAVRECRASGRLARRIVEDSIVELLALPIGEARKRLNIVPVTHYHEVQRVWRAAGIDPLKVLTDDWRAVA